MVQILPKVPSFGEQFSQAIAQGISGGTSNLPELAMQLAAQKRGRQQQLAESSQELLKGHIPDATAAQLGAIASQAEKFKGSPGQIQKQIADLVTKEANKVNRLESVHEAPGIKSSIKEFFKEGYVPGQEERIREAAAAAKDVDKVVARERLAKKGYNAEARERAISSLEPSAQKIVSALPKESNKLKAIFLEGKGLKGETTSRANDIRKDQLNQNLQHVLSAHPDANLVLLRKEYEKRGVDWRDFKDAVLGLEERGFKFNDEQKSLLKDITRPPLDRLEKALRNMKIVRD